MKFIALASLLFLTACAAQVTAPVVVPDGDTENLTLTPTSFSSLPEWQAENFQDFAQAYDRSCNRLLKKNSQSLLKGEAFGAAQEWQIACRKFDKINKINASEIRQFFETNFTPHHAKAGNDPQGLFTGYYEASLKGSLTQKGPYQYPLRGRPNDLVMVDLGAFRDELKGQRIAGRVQSGQLKPYETHAQITSGKLPAGQDNALVWVDSAVDAFFIQIQGSGVVSMEDGSRMRVGYAGQNGHPYYAIGRELVAHGHLNKEDVSLQSIRSWLGDNLHQAQDIMQTNKSYVFFTKIDGEGPIGGEGVPLTAMRSLAVDHSLLPYGIPIFISVDHPTLDNQNINRLMMAQDTGGAIRGPVRGDFFWGYGPQAENLAGAMKSQGQYWILMPNAL